MTHKSIKIYFQLDFKKIVRQQDVGTLLKEYFAAGVGGAMTGRGADLLIIDDPHSEQDVNSPNAFEKTYEWYTSGYVNVCNQEEELFWS